jgi:hypothetical protein
MERLLLAVIVLVLCGCSEDKSGLSPAERAKQGHGMSDEIWKIYSGTESGVSEDDKKGDAKEPGSTDPKAGPASQPTEKR